MLNVFKVSEYLWYTYACISLDNILNTKVVGGGGNDILKNVFGFLYILM